MKTLTNILILALFIIAALVAYSLLAHHAAEWRLIALYWVTLTVKNAIDYGRTWTCTYKQTS